MNLEKQIKRHIIGPAHSFFATALPGFESICRHELEGLSESIQIIGITKGGVSFQGRLTDLYRANLHLRTAGRILMRIRSFKATNFNELEKQSRTLKWALYLPAGMVPRLKVTARHSRLYHTKAVAQRIRNNIMTYWSGRGPVPTDSNTQTLFVRLKDDIITLSLDSSGDNLYRRGLKTHGAHAPLRETMAAAILKASGFRTDRPLLDPMCGAGTFSLEAALMAKHIPPGWQRDFAFMQWPAFKPRQWRHLKNKAAQRIKRLARPLIWASDVDAGACMGLAACVRNNGLADAVRVRRTDFFDLHGRAISDKPGLVVLNPPYGQRLRPSASIEKFYGRINDALKRNFKGWEVALMVPNKRLVARFTLGLKGSVLDHGGLRLTLLTGRI